MQELPALKAIHKQYADAGLRIVSINLTSKDSASQARKVAKRFDLPFDTLLDGTGEVSRLFHRNMYPPYMILLDPTGKIITKTRRIPKSKIQELMNS